MINVFQPSLGKEEAEAVAKVLESNWLGKGKLTAQFEENFAAHLGVNKNTVCSTNCCSEGLFLSMDLFDDCSITKNKLKSLGNTEFSHQK